MSVMMYFLVTIFILSTIGFVILGIDLVKKINSTFDVMEYNEVMSIIDESIKQQFKFKYRLEYDLKDIRVLHDFEKELDEISKAVLLSFSSSFYKHIDYYHDRDYTYRYVVRQTEILLLEFINKVKIKTM